MLKKLFYFVIAVGLLLVIAAGLFLTWGYYYITRDLPRLSTIEDYKPPAVSTVFAGDGTPIGEFYKERRYPIKLKDVPPMVRNAFIASEDASFYQHPGIDFWSILRAAYVNIERGEAKQGGSTITQQVVKNLLLSSEKKIQRKIKEAILAYQLEKRLSKDEIFEIYLNQIFFGNTAYGLKAAARSYFRKEVHELTLPEAALLAGLPKAPTRFSPILHAERAKRRQRYVLTQMVKAGFISRGEAEEALRQELRVYAAGAQNIFHAPFYVSEVRRLFQELWKDLNVDVDGLEIHTALDIVADEMAVRALRKGLREVDKRRGWRGPVGFIAGGDRQKFVEQYGAWPREALEEGVIYPALVIEVAMARGEAVVSLGDYTSVVNLKEASWARKRLDADERVFFMSPEQTLKVGDVIEVSLGTRAADGTSAKNGAVESPNVQKILVLDQTPLIEGALVLLNPYSGEVLAAVGGYSYQRSQFNRVTQSLRQPGSAFKPVVYLAAVDGFKFTPATIVYDSPRTFRVGAQLWTPGNFDEKYLGPITLRVALEKSRNLVSADIVSRIGVDAVIQYARKLGIQSRLGPNLSIALGSSEVTLLELTRAYGVFAAKGVLFDSVFVTKIVDRQGSVIYDYENEKLSKARQVINENSAFIMANLMKGVVEHGTGYRVREIGRPVAGKTGTSNEEMDTWFIGFTPQWACGVWVGFDVKKKIGEKETGGRVAAPIFLYMMRDFLKYKDEQNYAKLVEEAKAEAERLGIEYVAPEPLEPLDFSVPDGVDPFWVDKESGRLVSEGIPGAILEYFIKGTEPSKPLEEEQTPESYLESPDL